MPQLRGKSWDDIISLVLRIAAIVFVVEFPVMLTLEALGHNQAIPRWLLTLIGSVLLVLCCAPMIWWWVVQPYVLSRDQAERRSKQLIERLRRRNAQFDAALQNMQHGLAMFDSQQRIVVANQQFALIYGLSPEEVAPGTTLLEIVNARIEKGNYTDGTPEAYREERLNAMRDASSTTEQLRDGRWIATSVCPLDGGGWVTTHNDVSRQHRSYKKIQFIAQHDALTGLSNRVLLDEELHRILMLMKRGDMAAVHLLDLDNFKIVNDTLGHQAGDKLLQAVAGRLSGLVRQSDIVARMGGDEFAVAQTTIPGLSDATGLAERIIEVVSKPYTIDGQQIVIGVSIGTALAPDDGLAVDELLRKADLALYDAKDSGRGRFRFFDSKLEDQIVLRSSMERDLNKAIELNQFELFYQPFVDLEKRQITGFEALLRWHHPTRGLIGPADFIPFAEKSELIDRVGRWVMEQACLTAATWPQHLRVAVNLSPAQFRNAGLFESIVCALAESGLPPQRLEVEITETVILESTEAILATLQQIRELGVSVALDDFGTGYSSLSYLQKFPIDRIKIDHSFIGNITTNLGSQEIVKAMAMLADGLGMNLTVEGIETAEQLEAIRAMRGAEGQGFLFSGPLPAHKIDLCIPVGFSGRTAPVVSAA